MEVLSYRKQKSKPETSIKRPIIINAQIHQLPEYEKDLDVALQKVTSEPVTKIDSQLQVRWYEQGDSVPRKSKLYLFCDRIDVLSASKIAWLTRREAKLNKFAKLIVTIYKIASRPV